MVVGPESGQHRGLGLKEVRTLRSKVMSELWSWSWGSGLYGYDRYPDHGEKCLLLHGKEKVR